MHSCLYIIEFARQALSRELNLLALLPEVTNDTLERLRHAIDTLDQVIREMVKQLEG